ncbi:MAG: cation:proton antiporter [Pseudomonadota bacterium]
MDTFLFQGTIFLAATVIAVPLAARLGLGSVLGYLVAGLVIGPLLGLVGETENLQHFSEFGVVLMLFLIGLELDPRALWDMRHRLVGLGVGQILITMTLIAAASLLLGQGFGLAVALGMIFALSSTAIVLQTLNEKNLMRTGGGRSAFAVLLTQDIAIIPMLVLVPLLGSAVPVFLNPDGSVNRPSSSPSHAGGDDAHAHEALSLVAGLPGWGATLVTLSAIGAVVLVGIYLIRPLFHYIHTARLRELHTAFALLIVISIAFLMTLVGLSPALGTFLAGVLLANSEFRHELETSIEPFKSMLLGLFFITVGAGMNIRLLLAEPMTILALTLVMMALKGAVLYGLARAFRLRGRDQWLFTLGLAQAGEFGFVLIAFSAQQAVLPPDIAARALLIVALSMLLTPLAFIIYEWIAKRIAEVPVLSGEDAIDPQGSIIIAGMGRFGQTVNRVVQMSGFKTTVLDNNLATIQTLRKFGFKGFYGDPTRPEIMHAAGLEQAHVLVVALDDREAAVRLVRMARRQRNDLHIVARAKDRVHVFQLYRAGADDIVRELFDSSLRAGRYVLENMGLTEFEAAALERTFYKVDRDALRELAEVWKPGVPIDQNPEYLARTHALNNDLEAALQRQFDEADAARDEDSPPPKRAVS